MNWLDFSELLEHKGTVFDTGDLADPDLNSGVRFEPQNLENYFENDFHIGGSNDGDDEDSEEDVRSFVELAAKMTSLTEDGGVKKKVIFVHL